MVQTGPIYLFKESFSFSDVSGHHGFLPWPCEIHNKCIPWVPSCTESEEQLRQHPSCFGGLSSQFSSLHQLRFWKVSVVNDIQWSETRQLHPMLGLSIRMCGSNHKRQVSTSSTLRETLDCLGFPEGSADLEPLSTLPEREARHWKHGDKEKDAFLNNFFYLFKGMFQYTTLGPFQTISSI